MARLFPATHVIGIYSNATFFNMKQIVSKQFCVVVEIRLTQRLGGFCLVIASTGVRVLHTNVINGLVRERQNAHAFKNDGCN